MVKCVDCNEHIFVDYVNNRQFEYYKKMAVDFPNIFTYNEEYQRVEVIPSNIKYFPKFIRVKNTVYDIKYDKVYFILNESTGSK